MSSAVIRGCFYYPSYYYKMNTSVKKNTSVKYVKPLLGYHLCWTHVKISLFSPFHFHVQLRKMVWNKNGMFTVFAFPSDSVFVFLASTKMRFAFSEELFHTPLIHSLVPLWNILDEKTTKNDSFTHPLTGRMSWWCWKICRIQYTLCTSHVSLHVFVS